MIVHMQIIRFYVQFCVYTSLVGSNHKNNLSLTKYIVLIPIRHHSAKVYRMKLIVTHEMEGVSEKRWTYLNYYVLTEIVYTYKYSFINIPY